MFYLITIIIISKIFGLSQLFQGRVLVTLRGEPAPPEFSQGQDLCKDFCL